MILVIYFKQMNYFSNFKQLTSLEKINVAGNRLTTLPQCLSTLKTLTVLCAHSNQLTQLASLKECKQLRVIDIANNHLRELGDIGELLKTSDTVRHVDVRHECCCIIT